MKIFITLCLLIICFFKSQAQTDTSAWKKTKPLPKDSVLNMDAVYNRPFLSYGKVPVAVGGYLEANWQYLKTDGVSEGHQFQARRLTIFIASTISKRIKFLSEIEFEDGGKEIAIEFASLDYAIFPLLNFRGGIIMNPIGAFNQNHDGPKWEFIDRPFSATQMLPATWSNTGFGLYGKTYKGNWMFGYEAYLSGSFDNSIIDNPESKTFLPAAKNNPERFEEINSGLPLTTVKAAIRHKKIGELGVSYMGGIYNKFTEDGLTIDDKRRLDVFALDFNTTIPHTKTTIIAEFAWINVEVPETYTQLYGRKQHGGFIDIVQTIHTGKMGGYSNARLNISCRFEYVDWNSANFKETGQSIAEDLWSIVPSISFRPTPQTVFRFNYKYIQQRDFLGNSPALTGGFQLGFSTYF
jgi:hypothetical protein